jgi:hypothetical protein
MKIVITGRKSTVDKLIEQLIPLYGSAISIEFSEQYKCIQRGGGSEHDSVSIVIESYGWVDYDVFTSKRFRFLDVKVIASKHVFIKKAGKCQGVWEKKKEAEQPAKVLVMSSFDFDSVEEESDELSEYEDLEKYESRIARR